MSHFEIRYATSEDLPGVKELLAQMQIWKNPLGPHFVDENFVAVDRSGQIVGWLNGDHHSAGWQAIDGYDMPGHWRCSFINWLLVDESCRGNEIGKDLVDHFARGASDEGRDTIVASPQSGSNEQKLLEFYSRLGFRRAASGQVHWGPHGPQEDVPLTPFEVDADYLEAVRRYR